MDSYHHLHFSVAMSPDEARESLVTLAKPLVTLLENWENGRLQVKNREIALAALESAIVGCRIAYAAIDESK